MMNGLSPLLTLFSPLQQPKPKKTLVKFSNFIVQLSSPESATLLLHSDPHRNDRVAPFPLSSFRNQFNKVYQEMKTQNILNNYRLRDARRMDSAHTSAWWRRWTFIIIVKSRQKGAEFIVLLRVVDSGDFHGKLKSVASCMMSAVNSGHDRSRVKGGQTMTEKSDGIYSPDRYP